MASQPPPSLPRPGIPSGGGGKYVIAAAVLVGLVAAAIAWKLTQRPPAPPTATIDAAPPVVPPAFSGRNLDDDVPPPPPIEDAAPPPDAGKKSAGTLAPSNQCDAKKCAGESSAELERALQFRANQAHRCYDNALAQDPTLRGKLEVAVRIGSNGQVCSANIASNRMGSAQVGQCVAGYFRSASFPAPRGGCLDATIPINFVPRQ